MDKKEIQGRTAVKIEYLESTGIGSGGGGSAVVYPSDHNNNKHARALRRLIRKISVIEVALSASPASPMGVLAQTERLRAAIQEAREAVDG